ncbi:MAG: hypothetical protein AAB908_00305 [Patescibacteria group bacterium]
MGILKNKMVLLVLGGILLAGFVWYSFLRDSGAPVLLQAQPASAVDSDVVTILLQLRAVSLSGTIFTDPAFMSLQDFGSEIVPEPVGRPNPFAPLQGSGSAAATSSAPRQAPPR